MAIFGIFLFIIILVGIIIYTPYTKPRKKKKTLKDILPKKEHNIDINIMNIPKDKEKFIEAFTIDKKPFEEIPEHIKKQVFEDNAATIKGLSNEDKLFVAKTLYEYDIELNYKYSFKALRDFIRKKLNLKYKYMAENILRYQSHKAHCSLHRIELLQNGITKARWCYLGGTCDKHKKYNNKVFDLTTGLYDEKLKRHIFPTDLENCDCTFVAEVEID